MYLMLIQSQDADVEQSRISLLAHYIEALIWSKRLYHPFPTFAHRTSRVFKADIESHANSHIISPSATVRPTVLGMVHMEDLHANPRSYRSSSQDWQSSLRRRRNCSLAKNLDLSVTFIAVFETEFVLQVHILDQADMYVLVLKHALNEDTKEDP